MTNEYHNATNLIKRHSGTNNKEWTVCRFVEGVKGEPATFGTPLQQLDEGRLGFGKLCQVVFFDKEEAEKEAASTNFKIAVDKPIHISEIEWDVRMYSAYDGSSKNLYTGKDYIQAEKEFALGQLIKLRNHDLYVKVELTGKVAAK
jgi:hypothetical protein